MKKLHLRFFTILLLGLAMAFTPASMMAQTKAERKAKRQINKKAQRLARKEARKLKKDDWKVLPGSIPLEKQLERAWIKQYELDENGGLKYLVADGNAVGKTQTSAEMQALEAAKLQLAGQITNEIVQIIEGKIANEQLDRKTGNSLTKVVSGSKNYIKSNLPYAQPVFKVYRDVGKKDMEVAVKLIYNVNEAMAAAEKALEARIRESLESEADELIQEIDGIMGTGTRRRR